MATNSHDPEQIIKCKKCHFPILPNFNYEGLCEMCAPCPGVSDPEISPESLDLDVDYAGRSSLANYNDGRLWYLVQDEGVSLGQIAYALLTNNAQYVADLETTGALLIASDLKDISGDDFYCLYLQDAYVLKLYRNSL